MTLNAAIQMPDAIAPAHSLPVFDGRDFVVNDGANMGDAISFAAELELDDIYRLSPTAAVGRLSLRIDGAHFAVAEETELGTVGSSVFLDSALTLMTPDGDTTDALLLVELDETGHANATFVLPLSSVSPQTDYSLVGIDTDTARQKLAHVACVSFSRGTHITLANGVQLPIEELSVGDKVLTRDAGPQEIRWIGQTTVRATGEFAPIKIAADILNNTNDLVVSPDHRLFIYQRKDTLGAGRAELLVKARHLVNGTTITVMHGGYVDYFQLLFDHHQIIFAEGIAAESFLIDARTAPAVPTDLTDKLVDPADSPLTGLDVVETLLQRPDAADLLRKASKR